MLKLKKPASNVISIDTDLYILSKEYARINTKYYVIISEINLPKSIFKGEIWGYNYGINFIVVFTGT